MPIEVSEVFLKNKQWVSEKIKSDSNFFTKLSSGQKPSIFWIGCCDSRVIPSEILQSSLGEIFMHTNIANQVNINDFNLMSALTYAVNILKVEHIVVCGHTGCGGVKAAIDNNASGVIGEWVKPIVELYKNNKNLNSNQLSKLNIKAQIEKLSNLEIIQDSLKKNNTLKIHGWIFDLHDGVLKEA